MRDITPELAAYDSWVDADQNSKFEPDKGDTYEDRNGNGDFDSRAKEHAQLARAELLAEIRLSHKEELFRSRDDAHLAMRAAVAAAVERVEAVAATQQREERAQTEVLLNELKQGHAAEMAKSRHRAADALAAMEAIKEGEASRDALARHRRMADDAALVAAVETEAAVEDAKKRAIEDMERKHQRVLREEREAFEQQIAKERVAAEAATVEAANAAVQYNEQVEHARQTRARTRQELATAEETREAREARSEHLALARCVESMQATVLLHVSVYIQSMFSLYSV